MKTESVDEWKKRTGKEVTKVKVSYDREFAWDWITKSAKQKIKLKKNEPLAQKEKKMNTTVGSTGVGSMGTASMGTSNLSAPPTSRFDYVAYDHVATQLQAVAKDDVTLLETFISKNLQSPRAKALALTKLEEVYMWIGKAIRDDQIARNVSAALQESRNNS